ncbi:DNA repair protein RadA [Auritidibacter ignavus]|uniref:DNA repair protein RadA n=1 Tax=Auritidibacter ignavus TaxID=678932 RepID=UPI00244C9A88|nr:DNA repair protein RadA [Auritidibacter ignavus]WGH83074.1 DNA repair protein RadA [Auritidibacter ignavus]
MSSKTRKPAYRCTECGWMTAKWVGRCGECQAWGTVVESGAETSTPRTQVSTISTAQRARKISDIDATLARHQPTGLPELDRVLGGGLIAGGVVLLAGEPGIGKSTLVLTLGHQLTQMTRPDGHPARVLYITGEESTAQVRMRADRISAVSETLYLTAETDLGHALGQVETVDPDVVIVDSVQTLESTDVDGTAGGVNQIREVASAMINMAKTRNIATILIGHVTKEGSIAGPRVLEHLVDVVCTFEGDRHSRLRMIRAVKNRYGSTDEVGCFELDDHGITSVTDPSGLFTNSWHSTIAGTTMSVSLEGHRPLLTEIQALLAQTETSSGRRTVSGMETSRINMLLAVLERRMGITAAKRDVYVSTVGGIRISEPASDLAVAASLTGSATDRAVEPGLVTFGEVGLTGELRAVPGIQRRINEATRLGFNRAVIPASRNTVFQPEPGFLVYQASTLPEALGMIFATRAEFEQAMPTCQQVAPHQLSDNGMSASPTG